VSGGPQNAGDARRSLQLDVVALAVPETDGVWVEAF
jgi:hypothetical protein